MKNIISMIGKAWEGMVCRINLSLKKKCRMAVSRSEMRMTGIRKNLAFLNLTGYLRG